MKFYLSSYKIGDHGEKLRKLAPNGKIGYIPNALDFSNADIVRKKNHIKKDINNLSELGLNCELIDLQRYFNNQQELRKKISKLGAIFISGGNVFILRQAMKLSGLDIFLQNMKDDEFLYAGYSAAGCVLSSDLNIYKKVDNFEDMPYKELKENISEGLGLINFVFMPHWNSNHKESPKINESIEYCKKNEIIYRAIRDGEVIIIE